MLNSFVSYIAQIYPIFDLHLVVIFALILYNTKILRYEDLNMRFFLSGLTFVLFFLSGCEQKESLNPTIEQKSDGEVVEKKSIVPTFRLVGHDGEELVVTKNRDGLKFEGLEGKVVLLNFFASWCPPCKAEIPHLINLQNRYSDSFEVVGVLMEENKNNKSLLEFIEEYGINYFIGNSPENYQLAKGLGGVKSIPFMILYNTKGEYHTHYIGAVPEEMIEHDIKKVLEKSGE